MIPLRKLDSLNASQLKALEKLYLLQCPGGYRLGCVHCAMQCEESEYARQCTPIFAREKLRKGFEASHHPSTSKDVITRKQLDNLPMEWLIALVKAGDEFNCLNMECSDCPFVTVKTEYAEQCLFHYAVVKLVHMGYTQHLTRKLKEFWPND